jgi:serine/threonine-protein kinase HipA
MPSSEIRYGVWIDNRRAGTLRQLGDRTRFSLDRDYREDPDRAVLGLVFEESPTAAHAAAVRLPPWFSNLLPEGRLRDWIAEERHVNRMREMELMAQVGHDLPGAVQVLPEGEEPADPTWDDGDTYPLGDTKAYDEPGFRFSLAGVGIKFSMVRSDDRLTLPAHGRGGDWIVKLPHNRFSDVPRNEFAMMSLARAVGIEVPEILLVTRDNVDDRLPDGVWPEGERFAYAIRRFDRDNRRRAVHIEDLAQVRNVYSDYKYLGNFETVASLIYRRRDTRALEEFTRRICFSVLISNGDAHLKNWSLIYRDGRIPTLSPAYDLMATGPYFLGERPEDLGLKFGGTRDFHRVSIQTFHRLQERLSATDANLAEVAAFVVERTQAEWPKYADLLAGNSVLQEAIDRSIRARSVTLMRGSHNMN